MLVIHWNTSKVSGKLGGIKKYEDYLYYEVKKIMEENNLGSVARIQRLNNVILGSTVLSWILRYKSDKADVVHATSQVLAPAIFFRRPKVFIVTVHDIAPIIYREIINDLSLKIQWWLTPKALKKVDHIIAISNFTKNELVEVLGINEEKITVIYQGVDHSLYKPLDKNDCRKYFNLDLEKKYILVVTSRIKYKRNDLVTKILDEIRRNRGDVFLLKVGSPIYHQGVINLTNVPEKDMPKLYNAVDVLLHTSEYEGFGLPLLEAMACGVPVVAFKKASIPEVVGNAGTLIEPNDDPVQKFVEAILSVIDKSTVSRIAFERSRLFSWTRTAENTLRLYQNLIS